MEIGKQVLVFGRRVDRESIINVKGWIISTFFMRMSFFIVIEILLSDIGYYLKVFIKKMEDKEES